LAAGIAEGIGHLSEIFLLHQQLYEPKATGLKPLALRDRINGMSEFARKSARWRRLVVDTRRPSGRHARNPVRDTGDGSVSPNVCDDSGGPNVDDGSGAANARSEVPPGRVTGRSRTA
jgi:hypothetical protein